MTGIMINKIDHIGIAVRSIDGALPLYRDVFGLKFCGDEIVEEQGVRVAFLEIGDVAIELLEPLSDDSPVGKFLARRGEGIHHIALLTDEIDAARSRVSGRGVRLLSETPLDGAHGKLISFMHPKDTGGVLLELTQRTDEH